MKSLEAAEVKRINKLVQPDLPRAYEKLTLVFFFFNRSSYDGRFLTAVVLPLLPVQ